MTEIAPAPAPAIAPSPHPGWMRGLEWPELRSVDARASSPPPPILVATDLSNRGRRAIARALQLAGQDRSAVHLVHAVPLGTEAIEYGRLETELRDLAAELTADDGSSVPVNVEVVRGSPAATLAAVAEDLGARLIVMGGHGRSSWGDAMLGTVVERLLRLTRCPLLVVGAEPRGPYRRALAVIDGAKAAHTALDLARLFPTVRRITGVHAYWTRPGDWLRSAEALRHRQQVEQDTLERLVTEHFSRVPGPPLVEVVAAAGDPFSIVVEACATYRPDLIAIASRRGGALRLELEGSMADFLIEHAPADLILRHLD